MRAGKAIGRVLQCPGQLQNAVDAFLIEAVDRRLRLRAMRGIGRTGQNMRVGHEEHTGMMMFWMYRQLCACSQ